MSDRTSRVFPDAKFDKDKIMGREFSQTLLPLQRSAYFERVDDLIKQLNLGHSVQAEIDRYLFCMHIESTCGISSIPRELLVVCPEHVFTLAHLPDIGSYISKLIICHNHSSVDLMSRLIHYSMPYIKHNRFACCMFKLHPSTFRGIHQQTNTQDELPLVLAGPGARAARHREHHARVLPGHVSQQQQEAGAAAAREVDGDYTLAQGARLANGPLHILHLEHEPAAYRDDRVLRLFHLLLHAQRDLDAHDGVRAAAGHYGHIPAVHDHL